MSINGNKYRLNGNKTVSNCNEWVLNDVLNHLININADYTVTKMINYVLNGN